jgi:hypothetical protein
MKTSATVIGALLLLSVLAVERAAVADPLEARERLLTLPHADVTRLIGSWKVKEMEPIEMIYEFQLATMAMHGRNEKGGSTFEMELDADYRTAGDNAVWVIGTRPRPIPEGSEMNAGNPSIMGIEFTGADNVKMTVSANESFTLVRVP